MRYRAIGGMMTDRKKFKTAEDFMRISVDFTLEAANAFSRSLAPRLESGKRFRFVFCSGMGSMIDQKKTLWYLETSRKAKVDFLLTAESHFRLNEIDWT